MTYTIKDANGNMLFAVEGVNPVSNNNVSLESITRDLDNRLEDINKMNHNLDVSISSYRLISNTRTMESFGYYATEGFGEKIKNIASKVWEKIKAFFRKIGEYLKRFGKWIAHFFKKDKNKKKISNKTSNEIKTNHTNEKINSYVNSEVITKRAFDIMSENTVSGIHKVGHEKLQELTKEVNNMINEVISSKNKTENKDMSKIHDKTEELKEINEKNTPKKNDISENKVREVISKEMQNMDFDKKRNETVKKINDTEKSISDMEKTIDMIKDSLLSNEEQEALIGLVKEFSTTLSNEVNKTVTEQKAIEATKELDDYIENGVDSNMDSAIKWLENNMHYKFSDKAMQFVQVFSDACKNDSSIVNKLKYVYETVTIYASTRFKDNIKNDIPSNIPFNAFMILCITSDSILTNCLYEQAKRALVNNDNGLLISAGFYRFNKSIYNLIEVLNEMFYDKIEILDIEPGEKYNMDTMIIINDVSRGRVESTALVGFKLYNKLYEPLVIVKRDV